MMISFAIFTSLSNEINEFGHYLWQQNRFNFSRKYFKNFVIDMLFKFNDCLFNWTDIPLLSGPRHTDCSGMHAC